jgi:hypothetical protein
LDQITRISILQFSGLATALFLGWIDSTVKEERKGCFWDRNSSLETPENLPFTYATSLSETVSRKGVLARFSDHHPRKTSMQQ